MKRLFFVLIVVIAVFTAHAQNFYDESLHIFFPANSANLRIASPELVQQNQKVLDEIAKMLLENPQYRILIDGHANPVLKTSKEETMTLLPLSLERAKAVANYLVEKYKIDRQRLILTGAGGRYASGSDAAQNRRVNIFIITDRGKLPIAKNINTYKENLSIAEKWNISEAQGRFSSFEFTQENRFIAIERDDDKAHFGEYNMPSQDTINMDGLGTLHINAKDNDELSLTFSSVDKPSEVEKFSAVKETPMSKDTGTDLFTRAWRVIRRTSSGTSKDGVSMRETIGRIYLFSINGTYMVTRIDGSVAYISHWRWFNDSREVFLFSHNNWQTSDRTRIKTLNQNSLIWDESDGFCELVPAYNN